jgi:DNA polymerase III sliding clamp (beta) subunit (PCNA family)
VLANVLLRTQSKNQLLVAATDLNVTLTAELKCHRRTTAGSPSSPRVFDGSPNALGDEAVLKKADNLESHAG